MFYRFCGLRPGMIKFMLMLIFLFNLVGWSGIKALYDSMPPLYEKRKFSWEEEARRKRIYWNFCENLVKVAEENEKCGKIYNPYNYFHDLKLIDLKKKEVGVDVLNVNHEINRLQSLSLKSLKKGYNESDIVKARESFKEFIEPGRESREELQAQFRQNCAKIPYWFWLLYLKTLPLVFVLYLLWAKEEQGYYEKFLMPKPFRFSLLLILYPFIIGFFVFRAMRDDGRRIYAEAQLRRAKKLFTHISEEEQGRIEAFAKSNLSLSHWKQQLAELGLKPHHSLVSALLVTLMFVFVIKPTEASAKSMKNFAIGNTALEQIASSQNLARMCIDNDKIQPDKSGWSWEKGMGDMAIQTYEFFATLSHSSFLRDTFRRFINEFIWEILHIPLSTVGFELK